MPPPWAAALKANVLFVTSSVPDGLVVDRAAELAGRVVVQGRGLDGQRAQVVDRAAAVGGRIAR